MPRYFSLGSQDADRLLCLPRRLHAWKRRHERTWLFNSASISLILQVMCLVHCCMVEPVVCVVAMQLPTLRSVDEMPGWGSFGTENRWSINNDAMNNPPRQLASQDQVKSLIS